MRYWRIHVFSDCVVSASMGTWCLGRGMKWATSCVQFPRRTFGLLPFTSRSSCWRAASSTRRGTRVDANWTCLLRTARRSQCLTMCVLWLRVALDAWGASFDETSFCCFVLCLRTVSIARVFCLNRRSGHHRLSRSVVGDVVLLIISHFGGLFCVCECGKAVGHLNHPLLGHWASEVSVERALYRQTSAV